MTLYKSYRSNKYTPNDRRIVGRVVLYAIRVRSKKSNSLVFPELLVEIYTSGGQNNEDAK
jgi:hypothetical protein